MLDAVIALHPGLVAAESHDGRTDEEVEKGVIEKYKAMILLLSANTKTYTPFGMN